MRIVFMGTPDFAVPTLKQLIKKGHEVVGVITQPDRPAGRGKKLTPSPIKVIAQNEGLFIYQPEKIRDPQAIESIKELQPDVIVVVAYGQILPREILELPPFGAINVHASLLPKYRGAAPIHWAIINGEKKSGVTTMLMEEGLDTGPMLLKEEVKINPQMTTGELHDQLALLGGELLVQTLDKLILGQIEPEPQDDNLSNYAPLLKKEHEKIDWQQSKERIHNLIRGMNPWPGAYTFFKDIRLKIWGTTLAEYPAPESKIAGAIINLAEEGFWVQTGTEPILITKVQPAGKNMMTAVSFINGYGVEKGHFLGDQHE
ncbi:MAG: methionyl-tRNA formyltransferase [Peptococcales bacterium]|jgi:methionyl-tRNA formyltransferase